MPSFVVRPRPDGGQEAACRQCRQPARVPPAPTCHEERSRDTLAADQPGPPPTHVWRTQGLYRGRRPVSNTRTGVGQDRGYFH